MPRPARASKGRAADDELIVRLSSAVQVEQGLSESIRRVLDGLAETFQCEQALLAFRDADLDRIFLWHVVRGENARIAPENLPIARADAFLLDVGDATVCWNSMEGAGSGFAWDRRTHKPLRERPRLPGPSRKEWDVRSFVAVAFDFAGQPLGRVLLVNRSSRFAAADVQRVERLVLHLAPQLENLMHLRHLRARAIEGERGRIARDLHDGILQSLLSFQIQLDVLRRRLPGDAEKVAREIANLEQTLRNEAEELRRMVNDMRPLRVESADLVDLMQGFAERFRNDSGIALDLLLDSAQLEAPDRVCRELFQIYREALHNIKKHARASHVVVKLWQDDAKLSLVVDDNGQGFSFAGRFTSEELDRLRLGPISIKERTRSVGGMLTVESNPGHGARLTIEIPLD